MIGRSIHHRWYSLFLLATLPMGTPIARGESTAGASLSAVADQLEDDAHELDGLIDDAFDKARDYRYLRQSAARLHHWAEQLEAELERGASAQAGVILHRFDFELKRITTTIYQQSILTVSQENLGRAIDLTRRLDQTRSGLVAELGTGRPIQMTAAQALEIDPPKEAVPGEEETLDLLPIDSAVPVHTVRRPVWEDEMEEDMDETYLPEKGSGHLAGGMQSNPLFSPEGKFLVERFPYRGYDERLINNQRVPTNWGGDWFDYSRPTQRVWLWGPWGYGWGFGWPYDPYFGRGFMNAYFQPYFIY